MIYEGRRATCTFKPPDADGTVRVVWEITRRCNMLCRHCCTDAQLIGRRGDGQSDELRPEQTLAWLIEGRASEVYISGGEPLMVRELPATVGALLESGARVTVATNGRLVPVRLPDLPADVGFLVSLDSPDAVEYERVRRGGRLSDVLRALEALASEGRKFHLSCPLHPELVHNLSRRAYRWWNSADGTARLLCCSLAWWESGGSRPRAARTRSGSKPSTENWNAAPSLTSKTSLSAMQERSGSLILASTRLTAPLSRCGAAREEGGSCMSLPTARSAPAATV